ncbi:MAG: hypothetical protein QW474_00030 [Candidatus Aenigmatarchaeota archaeon]
MEQGDFSNKNTLEDIAPDLVYSSFYKKTNYLSGREVATYFINEEIFNELLLNKLSSKYKNVSQKYTNIKESVIIGKELESAAIRLFLRNHPEFNDRLVDNFNNNYTIVSRNKETGLKYISNPDLLIKKNKDSDLSKLKYGYISDVIDSIVEVKVSNYIYGLTPMAKYENIPMHHIIQLNWDLGFYGLRKGYILGFKIDKNIKYFEVEYEFNRDLFNKTIRIANDIYQKYLVNPKEGMIKLAKEDINSFIEMYRNELLEGIIGQKESKTELMDINSDETNITLNMLSKLNVIKKTISYLEKQEDILTTELKKKYDSEYIKNNFVVYKGRINEPDFQEKIMSLDLIQRGGLDQKALKNDYPEIYNKYYNNKLVSYVKLNILEKNLKNIGIDIEKYKRELIDEIKQNYNK